MTHLIRCHDSISYFVQRPWGNLLVYPLQEVKPDDQERFLSHGGIYRQIMLGPFTPEAITKKLFDLFGAAVIAPFEMPFDSLSRYEKFAADFTDHNVEYLSYDSFTALMLIVKEEKLLFIDSRLILRDGRLISVDSSQAKAASEFLEIRQRFGITRVFTPKFQGKNFLELPKK